MLRNQLIVFPLVRNGRGIKQLFQVLIATGVGLSLSGELADIVLANKVERWLLRKGNARAAGIRGYWRFRDDVCILTDNFPSFRRMYRWYTFRAD